METQRKVPAMPMTAQTIHLGGFDWDGETHSFRNDGVEIDPHARDALYDILRSTASPRLEIIAPPGIINLGHATHTSCICIQRSNVMLRGAGKNATKFLFTSNFVTIPTQFINGCGIIVTRWDMHRGWTMLENVTLRDFEIEDLNPNSASGDYIKTNSPSGIFGFGVDHVELLDLRVVNAKGNGQITFNGTTGKDGPLQQGFLARNVDILGDPKRPGKFAEGDGFNIGSYRDVKILQGSIVRVVRHALEGGTPRRSMLVDGVLVDQQGQGFSGINPTGYADVRIVNCHVRNIKQSWYHIDFTDDPGAKAPSMRNVIVQNNILERGEVGGTTMSVLPVRLQTIGAPSLLGSVDISHNIFRGDFYTGILVGSNDVPSGIIAHNDFSQMTDKGTTTIIIRVGNTGTAPAPRDTLVIEGNRTVPGTPFVRFNNVPEWKNTRYLRIHNNAGGQSLAEASGGLNQCGHLTLVAGGWIGGAVPAGGMSKGYEVTVLDATPGDAVTVHYDTSWPVGPAAEVIAMVTGNDIVTCWVRNGTGVAGPVLGAGHRFYIGVERR